MRLFILALMFSMSLCFSQERFKIVESEVRQVLSKSTALVVYKGELVLLSGLDFSQVGDGQTVRTKAHGHFEGNYSYTTALGTIKTVRKIVTDF